MERARPPCRGAGRAAATVDGGHGGGAGAGAGAGRDRGGAGRRAPAGAAPAPPHPTAAAPRARLFVALWPSPQALAGVLGWQAACAWPAGARPVPAGKVHLTLHFLGAVGRGRLPELRRALDLPGRRFELALERAAVWPGGVAVLEPAGAVPAALLDLHARLGEALRSLGVPTEARRFRPHATLARRAAGAVLPAAGAPVRWSTAAHVLVESAGGYRLLHEYRWPAA